MTMPHDISDFQSKMGVAVREHWKAILVEGILFVILGVAAFGGFLGLRPPVKWRPFRAG